MIGELAEGVSKAFASREPHCVQNLGMLDPEDLLIRGDFRLISGQATSGSPVVGLRWNRDMFAFPKVSVNWSEPDCPRA